MHHSTPSDLSSSPLSIAEQYAIAYQNPAPSNYTMVPNFINDLTYDEIDPNTGKIEVKRLSVYAIILYMAMCRVAGNENVTWKNTQQFAEMCNMGGGSVCRAKKELQKSFHQLEGNPLIIISDRKKPVYKDQIKISLTTYHQIIITDVWRYNRVHFINKKLKKRADSPDERADIADSHGECALQGADSPQERYIRHTDNKTPLFKEQHSTADADSVVSSKKEEEIVDVGRHKDLDHLIKIGYSLKYAKILIQKYTSDQLKAAAVFVSYQKNKGVSIGNVLGYFRSVLENQWYLKKG